MGKTLMFSIILLFVLTAAAQAQIADKKNKTDGPVTRTDIEKKFAIIDQNLKFNAKFRLSYVVTNIYDTVKNGKHADYYVMAKTDIAKQFSIATPEQKEIMVFYAVASALKKVEIDIEEMRNKRVETSTIFDNLNVKANELFDLLSGVLNGLKGVTANTVADIL
jgi:hypothetical protein